MLNRRLWILALVLLLGLATRGATAQEATPTDAFVTPDPAACQVEPRTVDELRAFIATAEAATIAATPEALPAGEPADDATVAAVTATLHEVTACENANAFLQVFALYTDDYLLRQMATQDVNPDALILFELPIDPQEPEYRISIAITDITVLPDGRANAAVSISIPNPLGGTIDSTMNYLLVEQDGQWLVDDIINPAE